jgi:precorrin-2 dehydrogenase/sirohydrochlorin ferrochelatase
MVESAKAPVPDYPLSLRVRGRLCVVVGAGDVGRRKARGLLDAGARVRVVDPVAARLHDLEEAHCLPRPYRPEDLADAFLVFAATSDHDLNRRVAADARKGGALVQMADDPAGSDFSLPALLRRDDLTIAVFSGGGSPALCSLLRDEIDAGLGPHWGVFLEIAAALRRKRLTGSDSSSYNRNVLDQLAAADLAGLIAAGDRDAIERLLSRVLGTSVSLDQLGVSLSKGSK